MESSPAAQPSPPIEIDRPVAQTLPVVLASPHSGRAYPADFLRQTHLDMAVLRRAEDAYVDDLFALAAKSGVPMLKALYPRSFVDANREPYEVDPAIFEAALPGPANTRSPASRSTAAACRWPSWSVAWPGTTGPITPPCAS